MRLRSINLGFFLISQALSAFAGNYESLENIREVAEQAIRDSHPLVLAPHTLSVKIKSGKLDQRLLLVACDKPLTVEQRIIATIRDMESTIEAGERRAFMEHIADDFTGQNEAMTRDQVHAMVLYQLNRHKRLQVQLFPIHVKEAGVDLALATFRALVTGGPKWIPESGQVYDFETQWQLTDGDWVLHSASWTPVALDQAF